MATQTPWGGEGRPNPDSFHLALGLCCGLADWASGDEEGTGEATSSPEVLPWVKESGQRGRVGIPFPELWLHAWLCAKCPHAIVGSSHKKEQPHCSDVAIEVLKSPKPQVKGSAHDSN